MKNLIAIQILIALCYSIGISQESKVLAEKIAYQEKRLVEFQKLIESYQDSAEQTSLLIETLRKKKSEEELKELKVSINDEIKKNNQATTRNDTYLKAEPSNSSSTLATIKRDKKISLVERVPDKPYYKIRYKQNTGYIRYDHIELTGKLGELERELNKYLDDPSNKLIDADKPSNSSYQYSKTPSTTKSYKSSSSCPTVQCSGRTKKGTRCKNRTSNCSGRCYLH